MIILGWLSISASGQINVVRIDDTAFPTTGEGIFYSLPRTVIKIEVTIERTENYKGPYADFALRYLGLKNIISLNTVDFRISGVNITTYPEPDPEQYYFIELGEKLSKNEKSGLLNLSNSGVILGTLLDVPDTVSEMLRMMKSEEALASDDKDVFGELFRYSADISVFEKIDTIIRKINIDTLTIERQVLKRTMVEKSPEQKAREAADFISKIKENRFNLISGFQEVNYNKETLEYMDIQLKNLEKEYLKLFTGVSVRRTLHYTFKYIPVSNQINTEIPIFKFSKAKGIIDLDESPGKITTIRVQRVGNTNSLSGYLSKATKEAKTHGFYYRIPELARVTLKLDDNTQEESQCLISQLGVVTYLPAAKWKVQFHKETGGIRSLMIE
jgi:hypothetical protein